MADASAKSLSRRQLGALAGGALWLAGCGFRPLYGTGSAAGVDVRTDLAATEIGIIENREGQILHNLLLDRFNPAGRPARPRYTLTTKVDISSATIGTQLDATTVRAQLTVSVRARLRAFGEEHPFRATAIAGYSTSKSDYASEVARQAAVKRAMRVVADDLRLQIASFFGKRRLTGG